MTIFRWLRMSHFNSLTLSWDRRAKTFVFWTRLNKWFLVNSLIIDSSRSFFLRKKIFLLDSLISLCLPNFSNSSQLVKEYQMSPKNYKVQPLNNLRMSRSRSRSPSQRKNQIYIGYLPNHATMDDVEDFFKGYGTIKSINLKPGYGKGRYAMVAYDSYRMSHFEIISNWTDIFLIISHLT